MRNIGRFIVIDDDELNNTLCRIVITHALGKIDVKTFTRPEVGLDFIASEYSKVIDETPAVLLLDINMPTMSGWEFLEEFEKLNETIKKQLSIYILSSSVDERDRERAGQHEYVKDYIIKPLKIERVLTLNP